MQCNAMQCSAVHYNKIQYDTIQYNFRDSDLTSTTTTATSKDHETIRLLCQTNQIICVLGQREVAEWWRGCQIQTSLLLKVLKTARDWSSKISSHITF
jgi:hypothetical protein